MFSRPLGPPELVASLLSLSTVSAAPLSAPTSAPDVLAPLDVESLLQDLARRFEPDNEIDGVLGPVVRELAFHPSLLRPEGLGGGDASWRGVAGGLEALVSIKSIATMITRMEEWIPSMATAAIFERQSLLGPLCRLGLFGTEWVRSFFAFLLTSLKNICSLRYPRHISLTPTSVHKLTFSHPSPVLEER
jgi:ubiquitin conjugation factor E4 B